jgi:hypothetical protein
LFLSTDSGAIKNNRSPRFPFITLNEAVDLLRKLKAAQSDPTQALKRPEMLKALDYASFHGAAVKTMGALRAYDLLRKNSDDVSISPVGHEILAAETEEGRTESLQKAALSPLCFRMIWRQARHSTRGEVKELVLSRGFTEQGAKRASRIYKKNNELAALADLELEPVLPERRGKPGQPVEGGSGNRGRGTADRGPAQKKGVGARRQQTAVNPNSLTLPMSTGPAIIPKGITKKEFKTLMETLRTWREQLVID